MSTYAIGDLQGCFDELQALLELIEFNPTIDKLWFTGDLVNRGPKSLEVLRYVKSLGDAAITVLGNHDLHLLARIHDTEEGKPYDTVDDILEAPDKQQLCDWLRHQPLMHHDHSLGFTLVHAGLPPQWDLNLAQQCAHELESVLQSDQYLEFLEHMYGNEPTQWDINLKGWDRLRFIANCFTRIRFCDKEGHLELITKGKIGSQPPGYLPWFQVSGRLNQNLKIIFGHWAAFGANRDNVMKQIDIYAIDSGCVYGNRLTALRLDDEQWFSVSCLVGAYA